MYKILPCSESILGNLCKESYKLRNRLSQIRFSLNNCQNISLKKRLNSEHNEIKKRRKEIKDIVNYLKSCNINEPLAMDFFVEITRRELYI